MYCPMLIVILFSALLSLWPYCGAGVMGPIAWPEAFAGSEDALECR
jgi:hypothetical protein